MKSEKLKLKRKKYKFREFGGITLISLVITIILLIILAGVAITLSIGENGLFNKAKYAKEQYINSQSLEAEQLNKLYQELGILVDDLPENTPDTKAGTIVKLPSNWETSTPQYVSDEDGKTVVASRKVASVYAVATGNGDTVPVPLGFYYVGGTLDKGVVISDNKLDQNKYAGQEDVPSGISLNNNTINYELKGNQFVWIPVAINSYEKYDWGTSYRSIIYNPDIPISETIQIKKYEGFYVGRFEAGLASTIQELTATTSNGSQTAYNTNAIPQSKAGLVPWNFIDYFHAKNNADNMYDTNYVQSGLITGAMWDTMITWLADGNRNSNTLISSTWGNFSNTTPIINIGRKAYSYFSSAFKTDAFETTWLQSSESNIIKKPKGVVSSTSTQQTGYILTTGASEECKLKNLYDIAGNLWEWTEEAALATSSNGVLTNARVYRGGSSNDSNSISVCSRNHNDDTRTTGTTGFRVVLYIK